MSGMTVVASSEGAQARLKTGMALKRLGRNIVGVAALGLAVAAIAWVVLAIAGSKHAWPVADDVMPAAMLVLAAGQILALVGQERADQADMLLHGLTVRIDGDGLKWTAPVRGSLSWDQIRFVVLARSRLWVGGPDTQSAPNGGRPDWLNYLQRLTRPRAFALDVPLAVLDHSRADLAEAIRSASGGRFPTADTAGADDRI